MTTPVRISIHVTLHPGEWVVEMLAEDDAAMILGAGCRVNFIQCHAKLACPSLMVKAEGPNHSTYWLDASAGDGAQDLMSRLAVGCELTGVRAEQHFTKHGSHAPCTRQPGPFGCARYQAVRSRPHGRVPIEGNDPGGPLHTMQC